MKIVPINTIYSHKNTNFGLSGTDKPKKQQLKRYREEKIRRKL